MQSYAPAALSLASLLVGCALSPVQPTTADA